MRKCKDVWRSLLRKVLIKIEVERKFVDNIVDKFIEKLEIKIDLYKSSEESLLGRFFNWIKEKFDWKLRKINFVTKVKKSEKRILKLKKIKIKKIFSYTKKS